jgi:hypothetical protein
VSHQHGLVFPREQRGLHRVSLDISIIAHNFSTMGKKAFRPKIITFACRFGAQRASGHVLDSAPIGLTLILLASLPMLLQE